MKKIRVIGAGPGARDYLLPVALEEARRCDLLLGSKRALDLFEDFDGQKVDCGGRLSHYQTIIQEKGDRKAIGIVVTGDPGFYSLLAFLRRKLPDVSLEVTPGISSIQYLFSKLGQPWQNYRLLSFHGRHPDNLEEVLACEKGIALLTDRKMSPDRICNLLKGTPYQDYRAIVGENLSYPDERIIISHVREVAEMDDFQMSVLVIDNVS